jgi:EAL domain-containing protein (putative c-di-GMP-specific phosphodiesterase class I)
MARELGKRTVAEFVGDEQTLAMLRQYGIDYAQGYHVGRPVPLEEAGLAETGAHGPAYA